MNETIQSILGILEQGSPELQIAAAQILGELKPREVAVTKAVAERLDHAEDYLSRHLLATLSGIGTKAATGVLADQLERTERADMAAHLLAEIGESTVEPLVERFDAASPEARVRILSILSRFPCSASVGVFEAALESSEFAPHAGEALMRCVDDLDAKQQKALKTRLTKMIGGEADPVSMATALPVIARIDPSGARPTLIKHAGEEFGVIVREAALKSLGDLKLTPAQAGSLLELLGDSDRVHIVEPAMKALASVEKWPAGAEETFRKLLATRDQDVRLFAMRAMVAAPTAEAVKPLVQLLHADSEEIVEAAVDALAANEEAFDTLLRSLMQEKDVERAGQTAKPLMRMGESFEDKQVKSLADKGCKLLLAQDPVGEVLLETVVAARPEDGAAALMDRAMKLRKQKKLAECVAVLVFLAQKECLDAEGRYQLAVVRLLLDGQDAQGESERAGDATMGYMASLVREGFPAFDRLKKESALTPQDLLRVGQHFSAGVGVERRFAAELLHHVADKHGRVRAGEEALMAIRAEGL